MSNHPMAEALLSGLEFRNDQGIAVRSTEHPHFNSAREHITEQVNEALELIATASIDKPRWLERTESDARDFLTSLGFTGLKEIHFLPEDEELLTPFGLTGSVMAVAGEFEPVILAREQAAHRMRREVGEHFVGALLVHELAHDTAPLVDRIVLNGTDQRAVLSYRTGFMTSGRLGSRGAFYEEGFAHFIAGWYLRAKDPNYTTVIPTYTEPDLELPEHLQTHGFAKVCGPDGYAIELLAHGIQKADIMSANDFVATMLATRRLSSRTTALRDFAWAIDQLSPDLYRDLQVLQYSATDWQIGLKRVHGAIS